MLELLRLNERTSKEEMGPEAEEGNNTSTGPSFIVVAVSQGRG